VVVPSRTIEKFHEPVAETQAYEVRLLCLLLMLRDPEIRIVYVTSNPVAEPIVDYYLSLLPPGISARERLTMLSAEDRTIRPLSAKLLERPTLLTRIRWAIPDHEDAYLVPFVCTELEHELGHALGIASPAHPAAIMNAMASQLSAAQIADVAAYFASLPGAPAGTAKSGQLPNVARTNLAFPEDYKATFVKYHTINFPATKQVRHYFANPAAVEAANTGKPLPDGSYLFTEVYAAKVDEKGNPVTGPDGFFVAEKPLFYTAMGTGAGWGDAIPAPLRNGNWNYGVFTLDKKHRPINQAECLGCHQPLSKESYVFTLKQLSAAK